MMKTQLPGTENRSWSTPQRYQQALRLERAEHLIGHGATAEAAARAVGFQTLVDAALVG